MGEDSALQSVKNESDGRRWSSMTMSGITKALKRIFSFGRAK